MEHTGVGFLGKLFKSILPVLEIINLLGNHPILLIFAQQKQETVLSLIVHQCSFLRTLLGTPNCSKEKLARSRGHSTKLRKKLNVLPRFQNILRWCYDLGST